MRSSVSLASLCTLLVAVLCGAPAQAENPIVPGWYADPELRLYENRFWIYPTYSDDYGEPYRSDTFSQWQTEQRARTDRVWPPFLKHTFFHAFSSEDMVHWKMHPFVLDVKDVKWAAYSLWAPSAIKHNGRYYLFFGANDIKDNQQVGGIGVAVSDQPQGPFRDAIGKPLIDRFHNGAQPIDQMVFTDDDGSVFKEITPSPDYVEGPFMIRRNGIYYLMWSEGDWTGPDYRVAYATANNPTGPFEPGGVILAQDDQIARGAGHHSVLNIPGTDDWYIAYHRRPLGATNGNHRELAIERMKFDDDGSIQPVKMTNTGTGKVHLKQ